MSKEIFLVCNPEFRVDCKLFFDKFTKKFNYLDRIELKYTPDEVYKLYPIDLDIIRTGNVPTLMIIDNRYTGMFKGEPVRLLFSETFFEKSDDEKNDAILHELGHYFTNYEIKEVIEYNAHNPGKINPILIPLFFDLSEKHNFCLKQLNKLTKLGAEVNGELWIYKNELKNSKTRLQRYCDKLQQSIQYIEGLEVNKKFFFEIPETNQFVLWRLAVLNEIDFDFKNKCIEKIRYLNKILHEKAEQSGWGGIKQIKYQNKILKCIVYKKQNISRLIQMYEEIFEEFVRIIATFFNDNYQPFIINQYGFS